ncbi:hypothetical protein ICN17_01435 [Polynucleobacter sp. 73C-SIWE]|uniref:hypothetical protein n=1 Tax=Polynucleobacter sp. 73C-SIWE TaxID=2689098 RepID=UPI001C0C5D0E|nr:hypothetical protein [Polynucleobacter sp. 73C-SIWE]MBU3578665.1 hypothetical protein [Polynucleobacter sp. 73C-SIWE]
MTNLNSIRLPTIKPKFQDRRQAALFALMSGLWLLFIAIHFKSTIYSPYFEALQQATANFFVKCDSEKCSSIILPLLGYLLVPQQPAVNFLYLWMLLVAVMGIYLLYRTLNRSTFSFYQLLPMGILGITALLESTTPFHPEYLPCTLAAFIGIFGAKNKQPGWQYFAVAVMLFDATLGTLVMLSLTILSLFSSPTKEKRIFILGILKSILLGHAIIYIYLILIEYDFLQWNLLKDIATTPVPARENYLYVIFIYLGSLFALLFIHAEQSKSQP